MTTTIPMRVRAHGRNSNLIERLEQVLYRLGLSGHGFATQAASFMVAA